VFYTDSLYPAYYRQRLFLCDYGANWIKVATVDASDRLVAIDPFATGADGPVDIATDPVTGDVLYISIMTGELRRIRYTGPTGDAPPVVASAATPTTGAAPLAVQFSSAGSFDPDNDPLSFGWSFGDGQGSILASPSHSFAAAGVYHPVLSVTDGRGGVARDTLEVTVVPNVGFPATATLDDFNRPNGPIAAPWVGQTTGLAVDQNQMVQSSGTYISPVWGGAVFGPDQEAFVTLDALTPSSPEHDLLLKIQGPSWNAGNLKVNYDVRYGQVYAKTYTPGVGWQSYPGSIPVTFQAHDVFGARALSTGDVEIYRNGVKLGTLSVRGWPYAAQGGRIGLLLASATQTRLDNFGGGTVARPLVRGRTAWVPETAPDPSGGILPGTFSLSNAFPNPSQGSVSLRLDLPRAARVEMCVYDLSGRLVEHRAADYEPGRWTLGWSATSGGAPAPPGLYFARIRVGLHLYERRVVLLE
jgi:PKD repeat protein